MSKLTDQQRSMLQLVRRSLQKADVDGWIPCTNATYPLTAILPPELLERDDASRRVRLTQVGQILTEWAS
jgi:hypothetical protein